MESDCFGDMNRRLEQITLFTPLGIRFWDAATETPVQEGLSVTARRSGRREPITTAFRTVSGIYAFQGLPGLRTLEYTSDGPPLETISETQSFVIDVQDTRRRFVPVSFTVDLPLPERGIYPLPGTASPPESAPSGFYLFSAPSRSALPGLAIVQGNLVDASTGGPAAHAVVEVEHREKRGYGIADAQGRVALLFPYPLLDAMQGGSPPSARTPLLQQEWTLSIRIRYAPDALIFRPGSEVPELGSIFAQRLVNVLTTSLRYGTPSVLQTDGRAELLIETNSSPL